MKLAIECSGKVGSIALASSDRVIAERVWNRFEGQSKNLVGWIDEVIRECQISIDSIDEYIVSAGPGSFTSLRIAMVMTKVFAFFKNVRVRSFSSLELLAYSGLKTARENHCSFLMPMIDARKGEWFVALFDLTMAQIWNNQAIVSSELQARIPDEVAAIGFEVEQVRAVLGMKKGLAYANNPRATDLIQLASEHEGETFSGAELFRMAPQYGRTASQEYSRGKR